MITPAAGLRTSAEVPSLSWLGHASFRLQSKAGKVVYIDPWEVRSTAKADLILITHEHYDHCSPEDVKKLSTPETVVVAPADCAAKIGGAVTTVKPGVRGTYAGFAVETVPAYNIDKAFHPKAKGWVGYLLTIDGKRVYHAGDADLIPEMEGIVCDVALLPVGGTYNMNAAEATAATTKIRAKEWVPMHWGKIVGSQADAEAFRKGVTNGIVVILPLE
ncbi:MAG: MBL fold metallo-hydrolase [Deltaproteobacteria bacterium]|nr:MBL fold metallo-hydrolase [Deltaproteobacteria bacterium]